MIPMCAVGTEKGENKVPSILMGKGERCRGT